MKMQNTVEKITEQMAADNVELQARYESWLRENKRFQRDKTGAPVLDAAGDPVIEKSIQNYGEFRKTLVKHGR